jgi:patatin-like phospholipase/acyl hydrolase
MRRILSLDGGGIRGIIPAVLLARLERETGRPTRETFDFVAGTSTGAVLAAGIAAGIPADELARLYEQRAAEVFRHVPVFSTLRRIATGAMYDTRTLHRVIREELGESARDWRLNDAPIDLLITAKRLADGMPWYFVRDNPANSCRAGDFPLADAATASAAAPTYLPPWTVGGIGELIDGGTGVAGCLPSGRDAGRQPRHRAPAAPRPTWLDMAVARLAALGAAAITGRTADRAGASALSRGAVLPPRCRAGSRDRAGCGQPHRRAAGAW